MNRWRCTALVLVMAFGCFICPSVSTASPVCYTASGSLLDNQGTTLLIDGEVYIDDQLRDMVGQPTVINDVIGKSIYNYSITGYALNVGQYSFSGNSGYLYTPLIRYPTLNDWDFHDLMWSLDGGEADSQWSSWLGEGFTFWNPDGTPQDASQYCTLADTISLFWLMNKDPILPHVAPFDLWLVKNSTAAPVPEPTALVLLGAGLLSLGLKRKHRRERPKIDVTHSL